MSKLSITVDTSKLQGKSVVRTYKNKDGQEVTVKELKLDIIPVKDEKVLYTADRYTLVKTHFVALPQTKEQRERGEQLQSVGAGITTRWKEDEPKNTTKADPFPSTGNDIDELDF